MVQVVTYYVGTGQDYADLQAWYNARKGNLVTRNTVERAIVVDTLNELVASSGFLEQTTTSVTTDSTHYFWIVGANKFMGNLQDETTSRLLVNQTSPNNLFRLLNQYTRIEGILIDGNNQNLPKAGWSAISVGGSFMRFLRIGFKDLNVTGFGAVTTDFYCIDCTTTTTTGHIIRNCMIADLYSENDDNNKNSNTYGITVVGTSANPCFVENNTIQDIRANKTAGTGGGTSANGIIYGTYDKVFNNLVCDMTCSGLGGQTPQCFYTAGSSSDANQDYNASTDTSAPGSHSYKSITSSNELENTTTGSNDLRLKSTSQFTGNSPSASSDRSANFDRDVAGDPRVASHFGIGADYSLANTKKIIIEGNAEIFGRVDIAGT